MLKTIIRHGCRLRPALNMRLPTSTLNTRLHTLSLSKANPHGQIWPCVFVSRRTSILEQNIKDAGQMRTPPPLTPRDIESRVLRICNDYDKIQEAHKNKITLATHFMNDLGLDSLDHVEIIVALENEFGFEVPDADYDKLYTIKAVVDYLIKRMNIVEHKKPVVSSASDPRYDHHHH
ncbi:unnamed protein product [Rotaria socialis]|uniref:Acyl carrier protein n=1 Tax=Rotaria socialis TaxID=392032 RepID=A0A817TD05_9BILA|nr:unnamed protein product [Rotaria socialis]CAF3316554.1 unnamed protein product [Rotaria socialis]CAF3669650.1 unnamed protein product [Rotaria socialis]CAF3773587.1 unnamed protein product [Rotaria socialis]CAF4270828.1 unnamed protein product [Rotaria socialis]